MTVTLPGARSHGVFSKTRRRHRKSKAGCFECKRRRVKCDEAKPSCTRCVLGLEKCMYPTLQQAAAEAKIDEPWTQDSSNSVSSSPPNGEMHSDRSPCIIAVTAPLPAFVTKFRYSKNPSSLEALSETDLHVHYLQHTSHTLSLCQSDYIVFQTGMPALALHSKVVRHSLYAVSAAKIAWDMIFSDSPADINLVSRVIMAGYKHYNMASEQMRSLISDANVLKLDPLVAGGLMLVPFATASQQINHWISSKNGGNKSKKLLSSTPRDVAVILRGIYTMLQTDENNGFSISTGVSLEKVDDNDTPAVRLVTNSQTTVSASSSRTHVMHAVVAATSQAAFAKLKQRVYTLINETNYSDNYLSSCSSTFDILEQIRNATFSTTSSSASLPPVYHSPVPQLINPEPSSSSKISAWLRPFANQCLTTASTVPRPDEPLTRFFLSFLRRAPQEYLDLVLPLLEQRLEFPEKKSSSCSSAKLTKNQALALDIYAHWSVLMFLTEEESWWIGTLPEITLTGMANKYGENFVSKLWPEIGAETGDWWPSSMLGILREIKKYK